MVRLGKMMELAHAPCLAHVINNFLKKLIAYNFEILDYTDILDKMGELRRVRNCQ